MSRDRSDDDAPTEVSEITGVMTVEDGLGGATLPREEAPVYRTAELPEVVEATQTTVREERGSWLARVIGWFRPQSGSRVRPARRALVRPAPRPPRVPATVLVEEEGEEITTEAMEAVRRAIAQMDADLEPSAA